MIHYEQLSGRPRVLAHLTGLKPQAFEQLLTTFEDAYAEQLQREDQQREAPRQRQRGGGRKAALSSLADKLLFILFYFRQYPTQEALAFLFGFSQGQACIWIHRLTPVLNRALGQEMQLPARKAKPLEVVLAECAELDFMIDGTERPIRRPQDPEQRKNDYSGKKKRHTKKNIVITEKSTGKIKGLGRTQPGRRHDKAITDEEAYVFPPGSTLWQDTGFQGYHPEGVTIVQPKKKPRGKELPAEEKEANREISRVRVRVEHSIGGVKVFRIVQDIYRNFKAGFDDLVMETACGLFNWRLTCNEVK